MSDGWFCFTCGRWHRPGTFCASAQIQGSDVVCEEDYKKWVREHIEDLRLMLDDAKEEVKKEWLRKKKEKKKEKEKQK